MKKAFLYTAIIVTFCIFSVSVNADNFSPYNKAKQDMSSFSQTGPDNKKVTVSDVIYKANKNKNQSAFKKVTDIDGYIPDTKLLESGGKYTLQKLMTYQEYFDLGIDDGFRNDIDPNRMVWVLTSKFTQPHNINGKMIQKAIVTTVYDAETGDPITLVVKSDDAHGLDELTTK
jgi:hypothetical protein